MPGGNKSPTYLNKLAAESRVKDLIALYQVCTLTTLILVFHQFALQILPPLAITSVDITFGIFNEFQMIMLGLREGYCDLLGNHIIYFK